MSTIATHITHGITLGGATYTSPLYIYASGAVSNGGTGDAIFGPDTQAWTIFNAGSVTATGAANDGVDLKLGGRVYNEVNAGITGAQSGIYIGGAAGTVENQGGIYGGTYGVSLADGGYVDNDPAGYIYGRTAGVVIRGAGTVENDGTISTGTAGVAIELTAGGTVLNDLHATLSGGVEVSGGAGSVYNSDLIGAAEGNAIVLDDGGIVGNARSAQITGATDGIDLTNAAGTVINLGTVTGGSGVGADLEQGGTVIDAGTIAGGNGTAIAFGGNGSNLLILEAGYRLVGSVVGSGSLGATNTIELSGSAGAEVVATYSNLGLANFDAVAFASGAGNEATLVITDTAALPGTIDGFTAAYDEIDVTGIANGTVSFDSSDNRLTLVGTGGTAVFQLNPSGDYTGDSWGTHPDGSGGTDIEPLVTRITTDLRHGISLSTTGGYGSPLTITSSGGVYTASGRSVVYGPGTAAWTVDNAGFINANYTVNYGIDLTDGGTVINSGNIEAGYFVGLRIAGGAGSVENSGRIVLSSSLANGVYLADGGMVSNASTGYIYALVGVGIGGATGTVVNDGAIVSDGGLAVDLEDGGSVVNNDDGRISGPYGIYLGNVGGTPGTVTNYATIIGSSGFGVELRAGGLIVNHAGGYILGEYAGVYAEGAAATVTNFGTVTETGAVNTRGAIELDSGGTVIDSGTVSGAVGTAIYFGGTGSNLLVLEKGYDLAGGVYGSGSIGATNTLELSGNLGGVTVSYNNLGIVNFHTVAFGNNDGHDETLVIGNTASLPGTIAGFTAHRDIIDLTTFSYNPGASVSEGSDDKLTIVSGGETLTLQLAGHYGGIQWQATADGHGGTDIEPACFARGTLILTETGECPVEDLSIGDRVVTHCGKLRPIKWIGRRGYRGAFLMRNSDLWPILVGRGALGAGLPRRELYLSAKHALYLEGFLVPVECLVDGRSIIRCECPEEIEYFHIELDSHDILLAEGAPSESFLDCDNRQIFHNAHEFARLYPEEAGSRPQFCAPRVEAGRALRILRASLAAAA